MNFLTLLKTFLILQLSISVKGSCLDDYIGDDFCDDENNNDGCDYDGGKTFVNLVKWVNFQKLLLDFNSNFSFNKGIAVWTPLGMVIVLIVSVMKLELDIHHWQLLTVGEVESLGKLPLEVGELPLGELPLGEVLLGGVPLGGEQEVPLGEVEPLEDM